MTDTMKQIVLQEDIERKYNRALIDRRISEEIDASPAMQDKIADGEQRLINWLSQSYYPSKDARLAKLDQSKLKSLIHNIFVGVAYCQEPTLLTSITGQLAGRLGMEDKKESILTLAEILAILCNTDAFDMARMGAMSSWYLLSRIPLSQELQKFIWGSAYLPPMVCTPLELKTNRDSGYLSHKESLILGNGNHHDGDICLDVLNKMNQVPLALALDFMCKVEEDPNQEFTIEKVKENALKKKGEIYTDAEARKIVMLQIEHWKHFKSQGYEFYRIMAVTGNRFHLTHAVDKRGRAYARGYHITTQGTAHKKACVELADAEIVEGVPLQ